MAGGILALGAGFAFGSGAESRFVGGAVGGCIGLVVNGTWMLVVASVVCAATTGYTYFHQDRRAVKD